MRVNEPTGRAADDYSMSRALHDRQSLVIDFHREIDGIGRFMRLIYPSGFGIKSMKKRIQFEMSNGLQDGPMNRRRTGGDLLKRRIDSTGLRLKRH